MKAYPDTTSVIDAISDYLKSDLLPKLSGADAFNLRVAINAVGLVRRELTMGPALEEEIKSQLSDLVNNKSAASDLIDALSEQLRAGSLNIDDPGVYNRLRRVVVGRLAIDQPRYSALKAPQFQNSNFEVKT